MQKMLLMVLVITLLTAIILPAYAEGTMTRPRLVKRVPQPMTKNIKQNSRNS